MMSRIRSGSAGTRVREGVEQLRHEGRHLLAAAGGAQHRLLDRPLAGAPAEDAEVASSGRRCGRSCTCRAPGGACGSAWRSSSRARRASSSLAGSSCSSPLVWYSPPLIPARTSATRPTWCRGSAGSRGARRRTAPAGRHLVVEGQHRQGLLALGDVLSESTITGSWSPRDVEGRHRGVEAVLDVGRGEHDRGASPCEPHSACQRSDCSLWWQSGRRAAALDVDDHGRHLGHRREASISVIRARPGPRWRSST